MKQFIKTLFLLSMSTLSYADAIEERFFSELIDAAKERTKHIVKYDGSYIAIPYPNGDVADDVGVCTDLIIRAYRKVGIDLQKVLHEDMRDKFSDYPSKRIWGLNHPDKNIDHRRVPNLQVFFKKHGVGLPVTNDSKDYRPGDLVTWMLPGNLPHIGLVVNEKAIVKGIPLIAHNVGQGPKIENILFKYKITGHYRYMKKMKSYLIR